MPEALLLAGSLGLGHEMMARGCAELLEASGWRTRTVDCLSLMGPWPGGIGKSLFNGLVSAPGLYDAVHFAHLRTGSRVAAMMDWAASARLVPALRAELERRPADLLLSVFATGASAAARIKTALPAVRTVVLCTDVTPHRIWVTEGTDLFLVTSAAAAESVRRYRPRARISVVPPPVRRAFYTAPSRKQAREVLGVPADAFCALVMDSGWGLGPLAESVSALAGAGLHVLAVAGRRRKVERRFRELAANTPRITPFGFTNRVPTLMAAADVVVTLPGATTCSEARAIGRRLLLLDLMPGHGRDNLLHELELGRAHTCLATPEGVTASMLALREEVQREEAVSGPTARAYPQMHRQDQWEQDVPGWEPAYLDALRQIGLELQAPVVTPPPPTLRPVA
jgi:UDP-N-acetylglucosamine:LPS N-acetylglucosamine transferase